MTIVWMLVAGESETQHRWWFWVLFWACVIIAPFLFGWADVPVIKWSK